MQAQAAVQKVELIPAGRLASADRWVGCRAEVSSALLDEQGQLLDRLIDFAFGVLGASYLDVRVVPVGAAADQMQALLSH